MPRGGARPGAGRKRGSLTQKTRDVAERAVASGKPLPLDVMLKAMHEHYDSQRWDAAASIAKDAAPYLHAKLASIEHSGPDGDPIHHIVTGVPRADDPT